MIDIIIKSFDDFELVKANVVHSEDLQEKYRKILFDKYECFSSTLTHPPSSIVHHHSKKSAVFKTVKRKNFIETHDSLLKHNGGTKTLDRMIMGILNVVNTSNYVKNLNKIRLQSTEENIGMIVNEILQKCCLQAFYLKIFVKLLKDMISLSGYAEQIRVEIMNFVNKFTLNDTEYIFHHEIQKEKESQYDYFCNEQKHKLYALSKNNLIIEIVNEGIVNIDINDYFEYFSKEIVRYPQSDVIIKILIAIVKTHKSLLTVENMRSLTTFLQSVDIQNKKFSFMVEELIILNMVQKP